MAVHRLWQGAVVQPMVAGVCYYGLQANMLTTLGGRLDAPSVVGKALGVRPATAAVAPGYLRLLALPHRIAASPYRW